MDKKNYLKPKLDVGEIVIEDVCLASGENETYDNNINVDEVL